VARGLRTVRIRTVRRPRATGLAPSPPEKRLVIDSSIFFRDWEGLVRVAVLGPVGYFALIVMLRLSRNRTLAQMNIFDFVYVVVIGNLFGTTVLVAEVPLVMGLLAVGLMIGLQVLVSWLTTKSATLEHAFNGEPALLYHRGRFLRETMRTQRVTEEEVLAAARMQGVADLHDVEAVVLETDGEFSVVHVGNGRRDSTTLRDVPGVGRHAKQPVRHTARAD